MDNTASCEATGPSTIEVLSKSSQSLAAEAENEASRAESIADNLMGSSATMSKDVGVDDAPPEGVFGEISAANKRASNAVNRIRVALNKIEQ